MFWRKKRAKEEEFEEFHVCDFCEKQIIGEPKIVFIIEGNAKDFCDFTCFSSWLSKKDVKVSEAKVTKPSLAGFERGEFGRGERIRRSKERIKKEPK